MNALTDFIQNSLYPALFDSIDRAFPEMDFNRTASGWLSPHKLDGSAPRQPRRDKSVVTRKRPHLILEQGGDCMSLVDFQMQRSGQTLIDAVKSLADCVGLVLPNTDTEEYARFKQRQQAMTDASRTMASELRSPRGAAVLHYLKEERGYDDGFIDWAGFGYISEDYARKLNEEGVVSLSYGIGTDYVLAIPYYSGNTILGFKFRRIDGGKPKYRNSTGLPKRASLFGLTGLKLTGAADKDIDITIVEGELDALHAQYLGIENIVAAAGGDLSPAALTEAKNKGVRRITLLYDTEADDESQRQTRKKILRSVKTLAPLGLTAFVAVLPSAPGVKSDVDSFLLSHHIEELRTIINEAVPAGVFVFRELLLPQAIERQGGEGQPCTFKNLDDFRRKTILLCNERYVSPSTRDLLFGEFAAVCNQAITKESIQEEADAIKIVQDQALQKSKTIETARQALAYAQAGETSQAITLMSDAAQELKAISRHSALTPLLHSPTEQEIKRRLHNQPKGIETPYVFGSGSRTERFIIPAGAITFVCAPTSHGKSKMLQNLALQVATGQDSGVVLFFTFEEDAESVTEQFENNYIGQYISNNNLRTIRTYNQDGRFLANQNSHLTIDEFKAKESEFFNNVLASGRLRVYYEDFDSTELIEAIRFLAYNLPVKAVFIDYIQLLNKNGCRLQRTEELKEICKDFKNLSVNTGIPIVMAAQLNREAKSPIEMHSQNIAEAADIERIANVVICLWNSAFTPNVKSEWVSKDTDRNGRPVSKTAEQEAIEKAGFKMGAHGKMFARLTKNRGGAAGLCAVLDFDGNTGRITMPKAPGQSADGALKEQSLF